MRRRFRSLTGVFLLCSGVWTAAAWATHEVDHRFVVSGYVRDAQGDPIPDVRVIITATRLGDGITAFTDSRGHYEEILHLHDDNVGEPISVTAGEDTKQITAQYNPQDKTTVRGAEVNFGGLPAPLTAQSQDQARPWVWPAIVAAAVVGVTSIIVYARKHQSARAKGQSSKKKRGR